MFARYAAILASSLLAAAFSVGSACAQKRVALVIGNAAYQYTPKLANPRNDAADMAAALRAHGFEVIEGFDLDKQAFEAKVRNFATALRTSHAGLFFYSGHGLQVAGQNYLVPIDAKAEGTDALEFEMIKVDIIHGIMERQVNTNILFLDACRDNPLARNLARALGTRSAQIGRGLAAVESGEGTLISFSTQPGNVALDGTGRNSPYTGALLRHMGTPGDDLSSILINVRNDVMAETEHKQVPWEHSALTSRFYFIAPPAKDASANELKEIALWEIIRESNNSALFDAYLKRYPKGRFANLAREKINAIESGSAQLAVPRPGDDHPVLNKLLVQEAQQRLYELNYDPGAVDGISTTATAQAILEFETRSRLVPTGQLTEGLLRRLRSVDGLKPWGAIVFSDSAQKWGMAWSHETRRAAVEAARASCGTGQSTCTNALTFFGTQCGAFASSDAGWSLVARDRVAVARNDALEQCQRQGQRCNVIATVCADGQDKAVSSQ